MLSMVIEKEYDGFIQDIIFLEFVDQYSESIIQPENIFPVCSTQACFFQSFRQSVPGRHNLRSLLQKSHRSDFWISIPGTFRLGGTMRHGCGKVQKKWIFMVFIYEFHSCLGSPVKVLNCQF